MTYHDDNLHHLFLLNRPSRSSFFHRKCQIQDSFIPGPTIYPVVVVVYSMSENETEREKESLLLEQCTASAG
jgi:hypothetical protein